MSVFFCQRNNLAPVLFEVGLIAYCIEYENVTCILHYNVYYLLIMLCVYNVEHRAGRENGGRVSR